MPEWVTGESARARQRTAENATFPGRRLARTLYPITAKGKAHARVSGAIYNEAGIALGTADRGKVLAHMKTPVEIKSLLHACGVEGLSKTEEGNERGE